MAKTKMTGKASIPELMDGLDDIYKASGGVPITKFNIVYAPVPLLAPGRVRVFVEGGPELTGLFEVEVFGEIGGIPKVRLTFGREQFTVKDPAP